MKAYILLSTKLGTSLEVVKRLRDVKETVVADAIFGRYDAIVILEAPCLEDINKVAGPPARRVSRVQDHAGPRAAQSEDQVRPQYGGGRGA